MASLIYHVTPMYDGGDLQTLADRIKSGKVQEWEAYRDTAMRYDWPTPYRYVDMTADDWRETMGRSRDWQDYMATEGSQVHCLSTLDEAIQFLGEFVPGGQILAINCKGLTIKTGSEYDHPVAVRSIKASRVTVIELAAAESR